MADKKVVIDFNHILYPTIYWLLLTFVLILIFLQIHKKFVVNNMLYAILILSALMFIGIVTKLLYVARIASKNAIFFNKPRLGTKKKKLADKHFQQSDSNIRYYYQMNLYLPDYKKHLGQKKNIFMKGETKILSISIGFDLDKNDIIFTIPIGRNKSQSITLKNIPLRKWFTIGLYVNDMNSEIYLNGSLVISHTLEEIPIVNNSVIKFAEGVGFNGMLNNFLYSNAALSPLDINNFYRVFKKLEHPKWSPVKKDEINTCNNTAPTEDEDDEDIFGTFGKGKSGVDGST